MSQNTTRIEGGKLSEGALRGIDARVVIGKRIDKSNRIAAFLSI